MIQQILDKSLLRGFTDELRKQIEIRSEERRSEKRTPLDNFTAHQRADLSAALEVAQHELAFPPIPEGDRRRGEEKLSVQDAKAYMARSPEVSNLQSAIEAYYREKKPGLIQRSEDGPRGSDAPAIAGERLTNFGARFGDRRLGGKFEQTDVRWIGSLFAEGLRKFRGKRPFVPVPKDQNPVVLPDENLRLIVVGDWGSGLPRAQKIGKLMRSELDAPEVRGWQRHVIHLGDVYYSGWEYEYRDRFLKFWPVKPEEKDCIGSFNINGNHDMYSGGWGYFDFALKDPRFDRWQGGSSLFSLANKKWQIFGLDTSYEDAALAADQVAWVENSALQGRKTMLFSHHQFCSSFEDPAESVVKAIQPVLGKLDVAAWLWGHEHRCMTFRSVSGIRYPACIGHGGVPVYQTHDADGPLPPPGFWEYREYLDGGLELWAKFGFVTLDFYGDRIQVRYINEDGTVHKTDTII